MPRLWSLQHVAAERRRIETLGSRTQVRTGMEARDSELPREAAYLAALLQVKAAAWHDTGTVSALVDHVARRTGDSEINSWVRRRLAKTSNLRVGEVADELGALAVAGFADWHSRLDLGLVERVDRGIERRHEIVHRHAVPEGVRPALDFWRDVQEFHGSLLGLLAGR